MGMGKGLRGEPGECGKGVGPKSLAKEEGY